MFRVSTQMISERALTAMLDQQSKVSKTQLELSSGRRVQTPADDPASAARILDLSGAIERTRQYQDNGGRAQGRLEREEVALESAGNLLQRANELSIQGNNDVLGQADTQAIAAEVRQLLNELFSLANSRDSNGEYIFSGYQTNTRPFSVPTPGSYSYSGDLGQRMLQISPDRQIADGNNGFEVFMDVPTLPVATVIGVSADETTLPIAAIDAGDITIDGGNGNAPVSLAAIPAAADAAERAGQLRDAINAVSGETGVTAEFASTTTLTLTAVGGTGITLGLAATATTATTGFTAGTEPSVASKRNIFETLDQLATELESNSPVDRYIGDIQLALENIIEIRASVGGRLNAIDSQHEVNEEIKLVLEAHRSEERDLDYAEAITRFERQMTALQAAQQSYVKIQSLSLFNFL